MNRKPRTKFDAAFYERFYGENHRAVATAESTRQLVDFVTAYLGYLHVPVRSVLDVGCGTGLWRRALRRIDTRIEYKGIEVSDYLCRKYGWRAASIVDFRSRRKFDLVVCQGVLQYLTREAVRAAIPNLSRLCRGALYLEVYTREDVESDNYDPDRTDDSVHVRSARWYRTLLAPHFISCGGGLYLPVTSRAVLLEMEKGR